MQYNGIIVKVTLLLFCIIILAFLSRFYQLGSFPSGMTWDETAIGYNAYGLVVNHRDEWLKRTPVVFQSFGDYKSPLLIYLTSLPVALFGLNALSVRLPVAISGLGLVVVTYFLSKEIFLLHEKKENRFGWVYPLFATFCITISPWAVHFSRMGFESMLSAFLVSLGVLGLLLWKRTQAVRLSILFLVGGCLSFVLALYAYHSAKVVVPLTMLILIPVFWTKAATHFKQIALAVVVSCVAISPLIYVTVYGKANERALSTTIFSKPNALSQFVQNYGEHLSLEFLLKGKDVTFRHGTKEMGVSFPIELILFCVGLLSILLKKDKRSMWWIPALFFTGLIPAALGTDIPHANRSLLSLPWLQITAAIGLSSVATQVSSCVEKRNIHLRTYSVYTVFFLVFLFVSHSFYNYVRTYKRVFTSVAPLSEMGYGYKEAIAYAIEHENEVDTVYFTNFYGQAYIYLLFFKQLTPIEYRGGALANYTITDKPYEDSRGRSRVLLIGTGDQIPTTGNVVKEILYPDGKVAFRIVKQ